MAEFAPDLQQPLREAKLQKRLEHPQLVHIQPDMLLYGIDENDECLLAKFVLYGREISANGQIRTRDRPRGAGTHLGKCSGIAKRGTECICDAMQQAAVGEQAFAPSRSVRLAQATVKLTNSQSGQKAL